MGLLETLNLPPPPKPAGAKTAKQSRDLHTLYEALKRKARTLAADGHKSAEELQKIAEDVKKDLDKKVFGGALEKLQQAKKLIGVDAPEAPASAVEPGPGEQSLKDFQKDLKSAVTWTKRASSLLGKSEGDGKFAQGLNQLGDGFGRVSDGLDKFQGPVAKALEGAALARKVEQCRRALARAQAVDLNANPDEGAEAMAELAALFGEIGGDLTSEVPGMNAYFTIIANSGEIFRMGARLRKKYDQILAIPDRVDHVDAPPPAKPVGKDTTASVALADLPAFLADHQQQLIDNYGHTVWRDIARKLRDDGKFDDHHAALLAALEREKGVRHRIREALHVTMKWEHDDWKAAWAGCQAVLEELEAQIGERPDNNVSYLPALRVLATVRPPSS